MPGVDREFLQRLSRGNLDRHAIDAGRDSHLTHGEVRALLTRFAGRMAAAQIQTEGALLNETIDELISVTLAEVGIGNQENQ
jgi:hypothetical protein